MTIDEQIFLIANGHHTPFFDILMTAYTSPYMWIPFYIACFAALVYKFGWGKALVMLAVIGVAVGITDYFCASILRPAFQRMRPSNPDNPFSAFVTVVNGYRGGRYGFPSCHAANSFAIVAALSVFTQSKRFAAILVAWAIFVCFTRMYLGVHYPSDILVGSCIGAAIGTSCAYAAKYTAPKIIKQYRQSNGYQPMSLSINLPRTDTMTVWVTPILIPVIVLLLTIMIAAVVII